MRKYVALLSVLVAVMTMNSGCASAPRKILVIAHRGDSAQYPENTLLAFHHAAQKGADLVELDTHATADGTLVVIHDATLDRTTNSVEVLKKENQAVSAHEYKVIQQLDAGSWKSPEFKGEHIPTLAQAVEVISALSQTLLERKGGSALAHAKFLRSCGEIDRIVVQSFDWDFIAAIRTLVPEVRTAALGYGDITAEQVKDLCLTGAKVAVWNHRKLNTDSMKILRDAGLQVWAYTIDDSEEWERLYQLGIGGIITDKPAACRAWLEERQGNRETGTVTANRDKPKRQHLHSEEKYAHKDAS